MTGDVVPLRPDLPSGHALRRRARLGNAAARLRAALPRDARLLQILFLATLLGFGVLARDFTLRWEQMALAFAAGLATQMFWLQAKGLQHKGYLSALVTCLGLSLLLRADSLWAHPLAATLALSAKFVIRANGKHLYNPANLGVIAATTLLPGTWISPGQWGNALAVAVWFVALGGVVTERARRWDIAWLFFGAWLGMVALRVLLLGQSWAVWTHQLGSGALLLFAFFMISDPMTTPRAPIARVLYAGVVALAAVLWQFTAFRPHGLLVALFALSPLVALLDRTFPGPAFAWRPGELGRMPAR